MTDLTQRYGEDFTSSAPLKEYGELISLHDMYKLLEKGMTVEFECSNGHVARYWISNGSYSFGFEKSCKEYKAIYAGPYEPGISKVCEDPTSAMIRRMRDVSMTTEKHKRVK